MAGNFHVNRQKLAKEIVQVWTEEELRWFVVEKLCQDYEKHPNLFDVDWDLIFGEVHEELTKYAANKVKPTH